jgi:hypothetical protein
MRPPKGLKSSPRRIAREILNLSDHARKAILERLDTDTRIQVIEQLVSIRIHEARKHAEGA